MPCFYYYCTETLFHWNGLSNFVDQDILSLEQVPRFMEDSYCEESHNEESGAAYSSSYVTKEDSMHNQFHIASQLSFIESSSSCSGEIPTWIYFPVPCRARTKRPCPRNLHHRSARQLIYPTSSLSSKRGYLISSQPRHHFQILKKFVSLKLVQRNQSQFME